MDTQEHPRGLPTSNDALDQVELYVGSTETFWQTTEEPHQLFKLVTWAAAPSRDGWQGVITLMDPCDPDPTYQEIAFDDFVRDFKRWEGSYPKC